MVYWWAIAGALLILEFITPATIFIFPAIVALLVGALALVVENIWIQGAVFFVGSAFMIALVRPLFVTSKKDIGYKQGAEALIGKKVKVTESIDNTKSKGRVQNGADVFPARSQDNSAIPKDTWVEIISVEGITAIVKIIE